MILQQVAVRGLIAAKYLVAARLLGPEQIGLVGVALLTLAIVESLSDLGVAPAIVQRSGSLTDQEAGSICVLQLLRGVVVAAIVTALAWPVSRAMNMDMALPLILLAAAVPLLRSAVNPGVHLQLRARNFRSLLIYETVPATLDFTVTILCIWSKVGPASVVVGTIAAESLKVVLAWTWLRVPVLFGKGFAVIADLASYGKWVWGSGVITTLINNADKVLVARLLGPAEFGVYQVAVRLAQLFVSDLAVLLSGYLLPTFAAQERRSKDGARAFFMRVFAAAAVGFSVLTITVAIFAPTIVELFLGKEWTPATRIVQVLSVSMCSGGLIAITVAYLRGTGQPKLVFRATCVQLFVLMFLAPAATLKWGAQGAAGAAGVAVAAALFYLLRCIRK